MASINFDEISYAEITTFLKVAQTLNMSLAARDLHVSQPAVSKRISNLERVYGIILFVRTGSGLQLTPAGKTFYQELLISMQHLKSAFTKASSIQAAPLRTLKLGYDGFFDLPLLYEISKRFSDCSSNARLQFYQWHGEECADLFNGKADILLCPDSYFQPLGDSVSSESVSAFYFAILVAEGNPFYDAENVTVSDLLGVPLTVAHINEDSPYVRRIHQIFTPYGFNPVLENLANRENLCFEILSRKGVGLATPRFWRRMDARASDFFGQHIKAFPIQGEAYPVSFVWRSSENDEDIRRFIRVFRQVISEGNNREILFNSYN